MKNIIQEITAFLFGKKEKGKIIRKITAFLSGRKEVVIEKEEIMQILPHRGRMLLLDRVVITEDKIFGEFTVTEEVCEGHKVWDNRLVLRGVELPEMAFQLLGVFVAKDTEIVASVLPKDSGAEVVPTIVDKICVARECQRAVFSSPIFPGDKVVAEMGVGVEVDAYGPMIRIESGKIVFKVGNQKKGTVFSVALAIFDAPKTDSAPTTSS